MNHLKNYVALSITLLVLGACTSPSVNAPDAIKAPPPKTAESPTPPVTDSEDNMSQTPDKEIEENENETENEEEEQQESVSESPQLKAIYAGPLGSNSELFPSFVNFQQLFPEGNGIVLWANSTQGISLKNDGNDVSFFPVPQNIGLSLGELDRSGKGLVISSRPTSTTEGIETTQQASVLSAENFQITKELLRLNNVYFHDVYTSIEKNTLLMYSEVNVEAKTKNISIGKVIDGSFTAQSDVGSYAYDAAVLEGFLTNEKNGYVLIVDKDRNIMEYRIQNGVLLSSPKNLGEYRIKKTFVYKSQDKMVFAWLENPGSKKLSVLIYDSNGSQENTVELTEEVFDSLRGNISDVKINAQGNGFIVWTEQNSPEGPKVYKAKIKSFQLEQKQSIEFESNEKRSISDMKLTLNSENIGFLTVSSLNVERDNRFENDVIYKIINTGNIYSVILSDN